jgi:hypothetical protein
MVDIIDIGWYWFIGLCTVTITALYGELLLSLYNVGGIGLMVMGVVCTTLLPIVVGRYLNIKFGL